MESEKDLERVINRKATGSLIYAILGLLGAVGIVLGPLAYIRSGQAINLIETHGIGQKHLKDAKAARVIALVTSSIWGLVLLGIIIVGILQILN